MVPPWFCHFTQASAVGPWTDHPSAGIVCRTISALHRRLAPGVNGLGGAVVVGLLLAGRAGRAGAALWAYTRIKLDGLRGPTWVWRKIRCMATSLRASGHGASDGHGRGHGLPLGRAARRPPPPPMNQMAGSPPPPPPPVDAVLAWCGGWVGEQRPRRRQAAAGRLCLDFLAVGGGLRAAVLIDAGHGGLDAAALASFLAAAAAAGPTAPLAAAVAVLRLVEEPDATSGAAGGAGGVGAGGAGGGWGGPEGLFLVNRALMGASCDTARKRSEEAAAGEGGSGRERGGTLHQPLVDAALQPPSWCAAAALAKLAAAVHGLAVALDSALHGPLRDGSTPLELAVPAPAAVWMVPLCGWLLEYPVLYICAGAGAGGVGTAVGSELAPPNNLAGQPLVLHRGVVGIAAAAASRHRWLQQQCHGAATPHAAVAELFAFSVPAALLPDANASERGAAAGNAAAVAAAAACASAGEMLASRVAAATQPPNSPLSGLWVAPVAAAATPAEAGASARLAPTEQSADGWLRPTVVTLDHVVL
eukprot:SAG22_NODE_227_length_14641_cov_11.007908_4_plen_532_part_00